MRHYDEASKVHHLVLWSGDYGIALADKWTDEGRLLTTDKLAKITGEKEREENMMTTS